MSFCLLIWVRKMPCVCVFMLQIQSLHLCLRDDVFLFCCRLWTFKKVLTELTELFEKNCEWVKLFSVELILIYCSMCHRHMLARSLVSVSGAGLDGTCEPNDCLLCGTTPGLIPAVFESYMWCIEKMNWKWWCPPHGAKPKDLRWKGGRHDRIKPITTWQQAAVCVYSD